jgi:hypothetical protein
VPAAMDLDGTLGWQGLPPLPTYLPCGTCRLGPWWQPHDASACGDRCHVLPGQLATTRKVIFFAKLCGKWSFLHFAFFRGFYILLVHVVFLFQKIRIYYVLQIIHGPTRGSLCLTLIFAGCSGPFHSKPSPIWSSHNGMH